LVIPQRALNNLEPKLLVAVERIIGGQVYNKSRKTKRKIILYFFIIAYLK